MGQSATKELGEQEALTLLKGWFNNKMTIVLIMSQYPHLRRKGTRTDNQLTFLDDLEHHYLRGGVDGKPYFGAIKWLKAFFRVYPVRITSERRGKALEMVKTIYSSFGFRFRWNMHI